MKNKNIENKELVNEYPCPVPKKRCTKSCKTEEPIKLDINWGWQIEAAVYSVIANAILALMTLITIILRK